MAAPNDDLLWDEERLAAPHTQADKSSRVRRMFDAIAPTYELVNRVFSLGRDRAWRRRSVSLARPNSTDRLLDVACGTGDFARAFMEHPDPPGVVVGCDFAPNMLLRAAAHDPVGMRWALADALALPFVSGTFSITSCAFGVRNFHDLDMGLREMHRVLCAGGRAIVLEFTRPSNRVHRRVYEFYASRIMPLGATLVSRDRTGAYRYLPSSVVSFPDAADMCARFKRAGFRSVTATPMTLGVVTAYVATK